MMVARDEMIAFAHGTIRFWELTEYGVGRYASKHARVRAHVRGEILFAHMLGLRGA